MGMFMHKSYQTEVSFIFLGVKPKQTWYGIAAMCTKLQAASQFTQRNMIELQNLKVYDPITFGFIH